MTIKIGKKTINQDNPAFLIAEIGVNHILNERDLKKAGTKNSLETAFKMIDLAVEAGVDAVKFQSFKAKELQWQNTKKPSYQKTDETYYELIKKLESSEEEQKQIAKYCKKKQTIFLSTPYDNKSVDFLDETIGVEAFKLASIELTNHLFTKYVASKGKPIIISTGLSDFEDVKEAVKVAKKNKYENKLILLQCTTDYPAKEEELNLNVIKTYQKEFPEIPIGFSDHSKHIISSVAAVAIGAKVLEKHFTLNTEFNGPDHSSSANPTELKKWVKQIRLTEKMLGSGKKKITESEQKNKTMKKYLVINPKKLNEIIIEKDLIAMRTGEGISASQKNLDNIIGKKLKQEIKEKKIFKWEMIN